jgi:MoxR-like ATPase
MTLSPDPKAPASADATPTTATPTTATTATPAAAPNLHAVPDTSDARAISESILFEVRRVIVGQDQMLERILVGLLSGGHILLEGVPGLAKTLTIKTLADVLGGSFKRIQFTPDLMPSDLVGTRIYRPGAATFDTELGPVFANFLLADEINRAPAKVQSALLEVMQEHQVTIGHTTYQVPSPFLVLATENPIEAEGTYPLPEAQVDRFMLKILVGYPSATEEAQIVARSLRPGLAPRKVLDTVELLQLQERVNDVYVDPRIISYAVGLVEATRKLEYWGAPDLAPYVSYGASPRGSINLVNGARALAVLRGRRYVLPSDVAELAPDVLRHRIILSYAALADGITPDSIVARVLTLVRAPSLDMAGELSA